MTAWLRHRSRAVRPTRCCLTVDRSAAALTPSRPAPDADGGSGEEVQEAVAAQAAKDKRASQTKLKSVRHELRKRFNQRQDAAVKEAKQDGYASGKADTSDAAVSDGDAGPGYGYVDPSDPSCGGLYDPEGVC